MGAGQSRPTGTVAVTVKAYRQNPRHRLEVPVDRIECVCGFAPSGEPKTNLSSWLGLTPITGPDPLGPDMPKHPARLEVEEPPWALAATLGVLGVDLVQVYGSRASNARQIEFARRDHVIAIVPAAVDATAMCAKGMQGRGCTVLRSGTEMPGYRNPPPELIDRIFGDRAKMVPTSSGDYLAVLPEFYRGPTGFSEQGRYLAGIAIGDAPDAKTMQVETNIHVRDLPEAFLAGAERLETIAIDPGSRVLDGGGSALTGP